ncbi:hypothetical protein PHMEG_00031001 [Phytophthora megakarya]|uniref:ZSWIM1/3 RNaseH-like domain-containing protein n=1 Tax=Phytophthora megakarya TaxID=4795 RepID=A0A225V0B1_9STRA|nr:hypothetical protein PHMEG_00031001 [Phytophthora megakarya]
MPYQIAINGEALTCHPFCWVPGEAWKVVIPKEVKESASRYLTLVLTLCLNTILQTRTHNHPTSKGISSSYLGAASADSKPEGLATLPSLVDAKTAPKGISSFLAENLKRDVTPQQARNIVHRMQSKRSAEESLQAMLNDVVHDNGDVLLLQNQLQITVDIAIQTEHQKLCFQKWGDCLADLLSRLLLEERYLRHRVYGCRRKSFNDEKCFGVFQVKNVTWKQIQTIVIDNDFVEWSVLEECFPDTTLIARLNFNLKMAQRDALEELFMKMLKR